MLPWACFGCKHIVEVNQKPRQNNWYPAKETSPACLLVYNLKYAKTKLTLASAPPALKSSRFESRTEEEASGWGKMRSSEAADGVEGAAAAAAAEAAAAAASEAEATSGRGSEDRTARRPQT